jgi:hypothetical protein
VVEDRLFFEFMEFAVGVANGGQHLRFVNAGDRGFEASEELVVQNARFHGKLSLVAAAE